MKAMVGSGPAGSLPDPPPVGPVPSLGRKALALVRTIGAQLRVGPQEIKCATDFDARLVRRLFVAVLRSDSAEVKNFAAAFGGVVEDVSDGESDAESEYSGLDNGFGRQLREETPSAPDAPGPAASACGPSSGENDSGSQCTEPPRHNDCAAAAEDKAPPALDPNDVQVAHEIEQAPGAIELAHEIEQAKQTFLSQEEVADMLAEERSRMATELRSFLDCTRASVEQLLSDLGKQQEWSRHEACRRGFLERMAGIGSRIAEKLRELPPQGRQPPSSAYAPRLVYLYASPPPDEPLDIHSEFALLEDAVARPGLIGASDGLPLKLEVDMHLCTGEALLKVLSDARERRPLILHFSMHGGFTTKTTIPQVEEGEPYLNLESTIGEPQVLTRRTLAAWLQQEWVGRRCPVSVVFLNACNSESMAEAFLEVGVPHVVCCKGEVLDRACRMFAGAFYRSFTSPRSADHAFAFALATVKWFDQENRSGEADKFLLLPRREDHAAIPFDACDAAYAEALHAGLATGGCAASGLPRGTPNFFGRGQQQVALARHVVQHKAGKARTINVWSDGRGVGVTTYLAEFGRYFVWRGRLFEQSVIWVALHARAPDEERKNRGILEQVCEAVERHIEAYGKDVEPRRCSSWEHLRRIFQQLESKGRRVLLVLDGVEDWAQHEEEVWCIDYYLVRNTDRLFVIFGSRSRVNTAKHQFPRLHLDEYQLPPLDRYQAARLFVYSMKRALRLKDLWQTPEQWSKEAHDLFGNSAFVTEADRTLLEQGDVQIDRKRACEKQVLHALAVTPLLAAVCSGVPDRIRQTAPCVTTSLTSLLDLETLRRESGYNCAWVRWAIEAGLFQAPDADGQPRSRAGSHGHVL